MALCLGMAWLVACADEPAAQADPEAWVTIRGHRVAAEVADEQAEMVRGLGQRDELPWDTGMLFVYPAPAFLGFWMKDMRFDIDIVWIRDGRIVGVAHRVPHDVEPPLPTYRPPELADSVLEVPAGYAQSRGWRRGDRVEVEWPSGSRPAANLPNR